MSVPDLKQCCQLCIIHHLIGDGYSNKAYGWQQQYLFHQLDDGAWGTESLAILNRAVKYHGYFLAPIVILALLPDITKELCLKECPALTEDCLDIALKRCHYLQTLDITENPLLNLSMVQLFSSVTDHSYKTISSVTLEDCSQVKDIHIQTLLRNAPCVQRLNIARCDITDQVFLLDEQKQLAREACLEIKGVTSVFDNQLQYVDVSRCSEFTSTGVRHLCTLCGPTLRSVNLAWSKVDCTAFLYLCGLGLPSAVEFFMSSGAMSSDMMEPLVYNLHQFDSICQDITFKWNEEKQGNENHGTPRLFEHRDVCIEDIHPHFISSNNGGSENASSNISCSDLNKLSDDIQASSNCEINPSLNNFPPDFQIICMDDLLHRSSSCSEKKILGEQRKNQPCAASCESSLLTESKSHAMSVDNSSNVEIAQGNEDSAKYSLENKNVKSENICSGDENRHLEDTTHKVSQLPMPNEEHMNHEQNVSINEAGDTAGAEFSQTKKKYNSCPTNSELVSENLPQKCEEPAGESERFHGVKDASQNKFFFKSKINSICLTATVFREEMLGLRCFQKFLTTNDNLTSITLYSGISGNFLSDNVLDLIGTYVRRLEHLCVEGSDKLTYIGITEIAKKCRKLSSLDLTGVSFVGDEGIVPVVKSLPLNQLKLAETRITGNCLNQMACLPISQELQQIDLSWCEEIENSSAIENFISSCPKLEKLMLRECCIANSTLTCIAQHSHHITELSLASNMSVMHDDGVILLSENMPLLTSIDLGWNSYLTNPSIVALLSNCHFLVHANLEGLKLLTSVPFLPLISVPEEICVYLEKKREEISKENPDQTCGYNVELPDLPCLPHRSSTYSTNLRRVNLTYSDFVEDDHLQQIVTVANGGIEILDYYGSKVEPSKSSLQKYLSEYLDARGSN